VSGGYQYTKVGGNSRTFNDFEMALDSHAFAIGGRYEVIPDLYINLGLQWAIYSDANGNPHLPGAETPENIKYSKDVKAIVLGVQYRFM
jgi:predicted porin